MGKGASKLWTPAPRVLCAGIGDVVKAYSLLLEIRHPDHHRAFQLRSASDPVAANAEAVVFSWLRSQGMEPSLSDAPGTGGPDYLCSPRSSSPFLIEVTSLDPDAASARSGWPNELSDRAQSFAMITPSLWSKAKGKASQLGGHEVARVLAICLTHVGAGALLGTLAAEWFMTSEPTISVALGRPISDVQEVTDLGKSAFLAVRDGRIVPMRQSISAALLISIWEHEVHVVGILHPEPAVPFDYGTLRALPFLRLNWPVKDGVLRTEWIVAAPAPKVDSHIPLSPTKEELRGVQ
jgi:hypothetical protein